MVILEKPYVSKFMEETLIKMQVPVLKNGAIQDLHLSQDMHLLEEEQFIKMIKEEREAGIHL